jgi:internalin A
VVASSNSITFPVEIARLTSLRRLNLQGVGEATLSSITLPPGLQSLDVDYCRLNSIPDAVIRLTHLKELNVLGNNFDSMPEDLYGFRNLEKLKISCAQFTRGALSRLARVPIRSLHLDGGFDDGALEEISALRTLEELTIWGDGLHGIPHGWLELSRLKVLRLNLTIRGTAPHLGQTIANLAELRKIGSLEELNLAGIAVRRHLRDLCMSDLRRLEIKYSDMGRFPHEFLSLSGLEYLSLMDCGIPDVPPEIAELRDLVSLNLSGNPIKSLPDEIGALVKLEMLWLVTTKLTRLPHTLAHLDNLRHVSLYGTKLKRCPKVISEMKSLETLILANTGIREIPRSISRLRDLSVLDVSENKIREIPREAALLPRLRQLCVDTSSVVDPPPEIVARGTAAIQGYFEALLGADAEQLFEAKLIIVGEGEVGKTCLTYKLLDPDFDIIANQERIATTRGIEIRNWKIETDRTDDFKLNVWDFGGQEIYHATHQFFLTKRSLYLFVWDARKEDRLGALDYWLNVVKLLSANSPVLIVLNKADVRIREIDQASLQRKFPNIARFHQVSALNGQGISDLVLDIQKTVAALPHVGDTWPGSWGRIRRLLEEDRRDYIDYEEYLRVCSREGLNRSQSDLLSSYLHDLGVILHFQDDLLLQRIVILRPEWGTNAVYAVLDTREVQRNTGRFSFSDLDHIWNHTAYPPARHPELLQLMVRFELCFQLGDSRDYIIPELLPASPLNLVWNDRDNLLFEYQYDFMPAGIITRFIARNHDRVEGQAYWRYGVVLSWDGTWAQVVSDSRNRRVQVAVRGQDKKGLLEIVRREFSYIHRTLNNPEVKQMVPCVCNECRAAAPVFFDYDVLRKYRDKGVKDIRCERSLEVVPVDRLLTGVYTAQEIETRPMPAPLAPTEGGRVYIVQNYHESSGGSMESKRENVPPARGPWASGGFYLVAFLAVIAALGALGNWLSPWVLPLVVIGGLLALSVIGALSSAATRLTGASRYSNSSSAMRAAISAPKPHVS